MHLAPSSIVYNGRKVGATQAFAERRVNQRNVVRPRDGRPRGPREGRASAHAAMWTHLGDARPSEGRQPRKDEDCVTPLT